MTQHPRTRLVRADVDGARATKTKEKVLTEAARATARALAITGRRPPRGKAAPV
jgi:hypothetical protein